MGFVILHSNPQTKTKLAMTTDFKTLVLLNFSTNTAREIDIQKLIRFITKKGKKTSCNKYIQLKKLKKTKVN